MEETLLINQSRNNLRTYGTIRTVAFSQENNCATGSLLDYNYFSKYFQIITIWFK